MDFSNVSAGWILALSLGLVAVRVFVGALVLSGLNRLINGFTVHYGRALATVVVAGLAAGIVIMVVSLPIGVEHKLVMSLVGIVAVTLVGGGVMKAFVKHPDGAPMAYAHTARVYLALAIVSALFNLALTPVNEGIKQRTQELMPQDATSLHEAGAVDSHRLALTRASERGYASEAAIHRPG